MFCPVISFRRYRLRITDQLIDYQVAAKLGLNPRIFYSSLEYHNFSAVFQLKIFSIFSLFQTKCNSNLTTEESSLLLLLSFKVEWYEIFLSYKDVGDERAGGFFLYPQSINLLLRTYAL